MFKWFCALLILLGVANLAQAQNLVQNPSFEIYPQCPTSRNDGRLPFNWVQATLGTADYFNACVANGPGLPDVPSNFVGTQSAHTGNAYIGVYMNIESSGQYAGYREYMQSMLSTNLIAGKTYQFEMYVSLADESQFAANNLGVYVSASQVTSTNNSVLNFTPQITFTGYITDKNNWTKISANYVATGGERYITIGCFSANNNTHLQSVAGGSGGGWNKMSYYYIDDVSLIPDCTDYDTIQNQNITVCASPTTATVLSPTLSGSSYQWSNGSNTKTISVNQSGMYTVKTWIAPCYVYDTIYLTRNPLPIPNIPADTAICSNTKQPIVLQANLVASQKYLWNKGQTSSAINVDTAGIYIVTATDTITNCVNTDTTIVRTKYPPNISLGPDSFICYQSVYTMNVQTAQASYAWSTGSTQQSITVPEGIYWVKVTVNGCSTSDSITLTYKPNPYLNIGPDTSLCPYDLHIIDASNTNAQSYTWNDGSHQPSLSHTGGGLFWVEILKQGCLYSDTVIIDNKIQPTVYLGPNQTFCKENSVTLTSNLTNALSNLWSTNEQTPNITVKNAGNYWLKATDQNGCYNFDSITIDTFTSPAVFIGDDATFCDGTSYTIITDKVFASYTWQDQSINPTFTTTEAGKFYVQVTDNNNCKATDTIVLSKWTKPIINTFPLIKVCRKDTMLYITGNFNQTLWNDGSTLNQILARDIGLFSVEVTDTHGCTNNTTIEVATSCPASIFVPNVFTPNNDGYNDVFAAHVYDVKQYSLKIYSRWGQLMFETTNPKSFWDGTYLNKPAVDDVYVYVITYTGGNDVNGTLSGNVTLLR